MILGEPPEDGGFEGFEVPYFDAKTKSRAAILLKLLADPGFIVGLVTLDEFMGPISKPTSMLQGRELEVLEAYTLIEDLMLVSLIHNLFASLHAKKKFKKEFKYCFFFVNSVNLLLNIYFFQDLRDKRNNLDTLWGEVWKECQRIAGILQVQLIPPRRVGRQEHRDNFPGGAEEFFRISVGAGTLDAIIQFFETRFGEEQNKVIKLFALHPKNLSSLPMSELKENISSVADHYQVSQMNMHGVPNNITI